MDIAKKTTSAYRAASDLKKSPKHFLDRYDDARDDAKDDDSQKSFRSIFQKALEKKR